MPFLLIFMWLWLGLPAAALEWAHQPSSGEKVVSLHPEIALYWPTGASLPYRQARMFLDEAEVSAECLRTGMFISYKPPRPLMRGIHKVRVEVGETRQDWDFEVVGSSFIKGCVFTAPFKPRAFDKIKVEMKGRNMGKAWVELTGFPDKYKMLEERGKYDVTFKIPAKLAGKSCKVEVFLEKDGELDRQFCEGQLTIAAPDLSIRWNVPENGATVDKVFMARGVTVPEATVELHVHTFFRDGVDFGNLPPDQHPKIKADSEGNFSYEYRFPPGLPRLAVTIIAVARDAFENASKPEGLLLFMKAPGGLPPLKTEVKPPGPDGRPGSP
ncbi:MAG: hypothetical protein U0931_15080 [Vulcanimicrobiota bacterium]